ncbi:class I SAM-dependent DNA methyltransferase [candidate division KSB1 bacterium]
MKNFIKKIFPDRLVLKDDFYETTGDLYDRMFASFKSDDFSFYYEYAKRIRGNILDLASGTGRLGMFFSKKGFNVTALEISPTMVKIFRKKYLRSKQKDDGEINIVRGDISDFHFKNKFNYVIMGYNSFNHLLTEEKQIECLKCINKCMETDGTLAFEILPVIKNIPGGKKLRYEREFKDIGKKIVVYSKIKQDIPGFHKIWWFFEENDKSGIKKKNVSSFIRAEIEVRDMVKMLLLTGFRTAGVYHDYNKAQKIGDKRLIVATKVFDVF